MTSENGFASWQQTGIRSLAEMPCFLRGLIDELHLLGFVEKELFGIRLALEEALVNAVKHGNREDPERPCTSVTKLVPTNS